jgi:hypothetical protein
MEEKRRKYIANNKTKKPTEIIIFSDGFSFSCGSILIKSLQVYGAAIIVGYKAKPDITSEKDLMPHNLILLFNHTMATNI